MALATPKEKFFAVLNKYLTDNSSPSIDPTEYDVGAPTRYTGTAHPRNTRLVLDAPLASTSVGRTTVYYDRIDMVAITNIVVPKGSATTVIELLPVLNEEIGINLSAVDIISDALPANGTFLLKASTSNMIYTGQTTITLSA